jgi:hypothetical protein
MNKTTADCMLVNYFKDETAAASFCWSAKHWMEFASGIFGGQTRPCIPW